MRLAIMVAALGLVVGVPALAPTSLMNTVSAQTVDVVEDAAEDAVAAELEAASGDPAAIAAIVTRAGSVCAVPLEKRRLLLRQPMLTLLQRLWQRLFPRLLQQTR